MEKGGEDGRTVWGEEDQEGTWERDESFYPFSFVVFLFELDSSKSEMCNKCSLKNLFLY